MNVNKLSLCNDWLFTEEWSDAFLGGGGDTVSVRLPHTSKILPLHYIDPNDYQMICGYRRKLNVTEDMVGKRLFLKFDGAAHIATVYVNGTEVAEHRCGYTAFKVDITEFVHVGNDNVIAVRLDTTENPAVPPFGFVIDYLTYGGLYREVWLEVRENDYIEDVFIRTPELNRADIDIKLSADKKDAEMRIEIFDKDGKTVYRKDEPRTSDLYSINVPDAFAWSTDDPYLYTCRVSLLKNDGSVGDSTETTFGFRTAVFKSDGFYLNGKKIFLRGLNRHQSYPYIGYAATEALQREDVRILQEELGCNAVRTSHYPQSQHFFDECDRRGMLVFTEIPGWQHIGDENWKEQACENLREMISENRNHPSIILWGVRINESLDDDDFYTKTNAIAHKLDPSRATSGVRYLEKSSLLEDVYAYNDFSHSGSNAGVKPKKSVTPDMKKGYLISECNGHMYPTKAFDDWTHRQEHALRHARVQNAAYASGQHAGCFGWCMFDYPTHGDFGSGDRICYHGVMDAFRNPKPAAALYASQSEKSPVLAIASSMGIGDYASGQIGKVYVFSNADEVSLYKNEAFVTKLSKSEFLSLPHVPFVVDDTIGELLETQEGYSHHKAENLRDCLNAAAKYGLPSLPLKYKLKLLYCMLRYKMTFKDGVELYSKYVGGWGGEATKWRFEAKKNGKTVTNVTCSPSSELMLDVKVSNTELCEGDTYDMAAVRIRILDGNGNVAPYACLPIKLKTQGALELMGPDVVTAEGGMCGTYLRTTGCEGEAVLTVSTQQTQPINIKFYIKTKN